MRLPAAEAPVRVQTVSNRFMGVRWVGGGGQSRTREIGVSSREPGGVNTPGRRRMAQQQVNGACLELEHDPFPGTRSGCNPSCCGECHCSSSRWAQCSGVMHPFDPDITMGMGFLLMLFDSSVFGGSNQKAMNFRDDRLDAEQFASSRPTRRVPAWCPFHAWPSCGSGDRSAFPTIKRHAGGLLCLQCPRWLVWLLSRQQRMAAKRSGGAGTPAGLDRRQTRLGVHQSRRMSGSSSAEAPEVVPSTARSRPSVTRNGSR